MKRLLQLALVVVLGVTASFVMGVHLRETPSTPEAQVAAEASEAAVRTLPATEIERNTTAEAPPAVERSRPVRGMEADEGGGRGGEAVAALSPSKTGPGVEREIPQSLEIPLVRHARENDHAGGSREAASPAEQEQSGTAPTFDVVRVNRSGEAVIAGRAEPDSEVELTDGARVIGRVRSDRRGEWVLVPDRRLEPGAREIGIVSRDGGGVARRSDSVVVVSVPDPETTEPRTDTGEGSAVAVVVPRDGVGPSKVLQRPASVTAAAPEPAPASDAAEPTQSGEREAASVRIASVRPSHDSASGALAEKGPAAEAGLSVETVDYDETGSIALSGTADPGARVDVFLDDKKIGETRADAGGRWEMTPKEDVSPGRYTLRADQLGESGDVAARIRLPFSRAGAFGDLAPGTLVVVQPGNSLWRIARRTYGEGDRYTVIYRANQGQIDDPDLIYPGQVFSLPETAAAPTGPR